MKKLLLCVVLFSTGFILSTMYAQQTEREFIVGAFIHSSDNLPYTQLNNYQQMHALGLNSVFQIARKYLPPDPPYPTQQSNLDLLKDFKLIYAANDSGTGSTNGDLDAKREENIDWISYFTQAKYMKWEAEGSPVFNENDGEDIKIKYEDGMGSTYIDEERTVRRSGTSPGNSGKYMIMGPDYYQYPRYTFTNAGWNSTPIFYKAVFVMMIEDTTGPVQDVCEIFVTTTYYDTVKKVFVEDTLGVPVTLNTSSFSPGEYVEFPYQYDFDDYFEVPAEIPGYTLPTYLDPINNSQLDGVGYHITGRTQFKVKWLGSRELFVDYIEVYDEDIWDEYFIDQIDTLVAKIFNYDQQFLTQNSEFYDKLKYYVTQDEPHSIDCYAPLRKIQSILDSVGVQADLMTHWYPEWDGVRNGDETLPVYKALVQPKKLNFWYFPYFEDITDEFGLEQFRNVLQKANNAGFKDFFVELQTWGWKRSDGTYNRYRSPNPKQVRAQTMLALAHGIEGIYYEPYYSYLNSEQDTTTGIVYVQQGNNFPPRPIYYTIQELTGRLKGTLGEHLLNLTYSDNYLRYIKFGERDFREPNLIEFVDSISFEGYQDSMHFHISEFDSAGHPESKYFFAAHPFTFHERTVNIFVNDDNSNYINTRLRNIEPEYNFDTTFTDEITLTQEFPAGEGYLYQMAPVLKYGGRLIYPEQTSGETLLDDMTIENGATLYVNGNYTCKGNITVKDGGRIVNSGNGQLLFQDGKKIIVEGRAYIEGTTNDHLTLDFSGTGTTDGITLKDGANLSISNIDIKNCRNGVIAQGGGEEPLWWYLNADSVNFTNCSYAAFNLYKVEGGLEIPSIPSISYCQVTGSQYGISAFNMPSLRIEYNQITNTLCGINLSQIPSVEIVNSSIITNLSSSMPGIIMSSCGGNIRGNTIKYHQEGINLGNSSPSIGGNTIEQNKRNGIYVGIGSNPDLSPEIAGSPPNYYPISGYNVIIENGNESGSDESEIYLNSSEILLDEGCNEIRDDREPLLIETKNLMNGENVEIELLATYNIWGDNSTDPLSQRFGNLTVIYDPYYTEPCPFPQSPGGREMVLMDAGGEVTDTIYSAEGTPTNLSQVELDYSVADEQFLTGDLTSAKTSYEAITESEATNKDRRKAYEQLYKIGKLKGEDSVYFAELHNDFQTLASTETDTLLKKIFTQHRSLTKIAKQDYLPAINDFDAIINQNPNSEEALYAEIDILTTALNMQGDTTQLGKMGNGKYLVKSTADFTEKLDALLKKHFGVVENSSEDNVIPKQYTLFQNYPNPFNPVTTIKYELPRDGFVELEVFDILGRRITKLVSEEKAAGRYEAVFNASNYASGIYIYRLQSGDFVSSKKMLLLK